MVRKLFLEREVAISILAQASSEMRLQDLSQFINFRDITRRHHKATSLFPSGEDSLQNTSFVIADTNGEAFYMAAEIMPHTKVSIFTDKSAQDETSSKETRRHIGGKIPKILATVAQKTENWSIGKVGRKSLY